MEYSNKEIVLGELIGLRARVVKSLDKKQRNLSGTVIDETKHSLRIETRSKIVTVVKKISVFKFYSGNKTYIVDGEEIDFRPEDRLEKALKFYKKRSN